MTYQEQDYRNTCPGCGSQDYVQGNERKRCGFHNLSDIILNPIEFGFDIEPQLIKDEIEFINKNLETNILRVTEYYKDGFKGESKRYVGSDLIQAIVITLVVSWIIFSIVFIN